VSLAPAAAASKGQHSYKFGCIEQICYHELYPGGPRKVVIKCEWLETLDSGAEDDAMSMLPRVQRNRNSIMNQTDAFALLHECASYNTLLGPHDPADPQCAV
jgi:hypothetical protein